MLLVVFKHKTVHQFKPEPSFGSTMIRRQVVIVVDGGKRVDGSLRKADELYYSLSFLSRGKSPGNGSDSKSVRKSSSYLSFLVLAL